MNNARLEAGFHPKGLNYSDDSRNNEPENQIGYQLSDDNNQKIFQHGSPNSKHLEGFTYMADEANNEKLHSYIDLSDASISLNNFGGLNYFEIYKNYIADKSGNMLSGIINYMDENLANSTDYK